MPDPTYNENKVEFGLKNVHYAIGTPNGNGDYTYGTPKAWPGAVNLNMDPSGEQEVFRADDVDYFVVNGAGGYEGTLEMARVIDQVRQDLLGDELIDGVLVEFDNKEAVVFALLWEFDGDQRARRHVMYGCTMTRPNLSGATTGENNQKTPQTQTVNIKSTAGPDHKAKASTNASTPAATYDGWYQSVFGKTATT